MSRYGNNFSSAFASPALEEGHVERRRVEVDELEDEYFEDEGVVVLRLRAVHLCGGKESVTAGSIAALVARREALRRRLSPHLVSCSASAVYTRPISRMSPRFTMLLETLAMVPA